MDSLTYEVTIFKVGYIDLDLETDELESTYELTPYHRNVSFILNWTSPVDSNFTVVNELNDVYSREEASEDDEQSGETIFIDEVDQNTYAVYSHFYSDE